MLRPGQVVVLCVLALLTLGVVMVNSAGMSVDPAQAVTVESILLSRSTVYMALAMLAMGACALLPIRRIVPASWLAPAGASPTQTAADGLLV
jgi:cell division protein FtsW (lipid II flippase)